MKTFLFALFFLVARAGVRADDRVWIDLSIHDQPAHLVFDTCASFSFLFRDAAERLKLPLQASPNPSVAPSGFATNLVTEFTDFSIGGQTGKTQFLVLNRRSHWDKEKDGVFSWTLLRSNVFDVKAPGLFNITNEVPPEARTWPTYSQKTDSPFLMFYVLHGDDPHRAAVYVDTGLDGGISLSHTLWKEWEARHSAAPSTVEAVESLNGNIYFKRVIWADRISIGSLVVSNVPVRELDAKEEADFPGQIATLGLYALSRLNFVLDGKNGVVYASPRGDIPAPPTHNHLGALFYPFEPGSDAPVAHVAPESPAWLAGIRDGDKLLRIDDTEVTKENYESLSARKNYWQARPGTKYALTLQRGEEKYEASVILRTILAPREITNQVSLFELRARADAGDAEAQNSIGLAYLLGENGATLNKEEAAKWFRKAADVSNANGECNLGWCYANGSGVPKDEAKAFNWFRKAAEKGLGRAQGFVGLYYVRGIGVKTDPPEGVLWLGKAAEQNDREAQHNLANCYAYGIGVPTDLVEACKWEILSARHHYTLAQEGLRRIRNRITPAQYAQALRLANMF
jgi:TPR repeat protein